MRQGAALRVVGPPAGLETRDTADLEVCATRVPCADAPAAAKHSGNTLPRGGDGRCSARNVPGPQTISPQPGPAITCNFPAASFHAHSPDFSGHCCWLRPPRRAGRRPSPRNPTAPGKRHAAASTGRFSPSQRRPFPPGNPPPAFALPSMRSCWPGSKPRGWHSPRTPGVRCCCAGCSSTSPACRPAPRNSPPSSPTRRRTRTRKWSSACSPHRTTASAGAATGSTPPATRTPSAPTTMSTAAKSASACGGIAITSSAR